VSASAAASEQNVRRFTKTENLAADHGGYGAPMARRELVEASNDLARRFPAFAKIVEAAGPCDLRSGRPRRSHFAELARAICYQQLAGPAARTIHGRFEALFDGDPTPERVVATPVEALRSAGLSAAKAASIRDLAEHVLAGTVVLDRVGRRSDDLIVEQLTKVRGIGRWTAEMFLMFQLGRLDVWPVDDLGVRKGYARLHDLAVAPPARALQPLGEPYRPYRSVAAWYCWRAVDDAFMSG
jgi:DNA-3-methyladenine glycosylase II